jgi:hypothetical protein
MGATATNSHSVSLTLLSFLVESDAIHQTTAQSVGNVNDENRLRNKHHIPSDYPGLTQSNPVAVGLVSR